jgi:hypothetical protein
MGSVNLDNTGSGSAITLSSDGTSLLLDGTAIGGGGGADLYDADTSGTPTNPSATGTNAVAIGNGATAAGNYGIGIGFISDATGASSVAIGFNADATGASSLAIGNQPDAKSLCSTAIGANSSGTGSQAVTGAGAMALGGSYASGTDSFAAATSSASSSYGATGANSISMGYQNKATGAYSIAIAGLTSTSSNSGSAIFGGFSNTSSGTYSTVLGGRGNTADAGYAYALGYGAHTQGVERRIAFAGNGGSGVAQSGIFCLSRETTDATATALTVDRNQAASTDNQIILPNNSAYAFHGTIVARQKAGDGTACAAWKVEGLIRREGSAGTTVLVNSATTVLDNTPSWGMALSADTTNGGLAITGTGAASTNIRWVATIHTSEVTYA